MATSVLAAGDIAPPTRDIVRRHRNTRVLVGEVVDVDLDAREVTLETVGRSARVAYDSLIVAAGAGRSFFGHDEFGVHAPGIKTIDDAFELRGRIFGAFELAELEGDQSERDTRLTIAVVGAGPTGVEVSGQIAELARRALKRNFRRFDPAQARVILLDAGDTVLASFPQSLRWRAHRDLGGSESRSSSLRGSPASTRQDSMSSGPTDRPGESKLAPRCGPRASKPPRSGHASASSAAPPSIGQASVAVLADCTLAGHPEVFVIGDLMSLNDLPGVAEVAMQSGRHVARTIVRRLRGDDAAREFRYRDFGTMATVSASGPSPGSVRSASLAPRRCWSGSSYTSPYLTGFKNRVATLASWTVAFLGRGRPERTITEQQVFARTRSLRN